MNAGIKVLLSALVLALKKTIVVNGKELVGRDTLRLSPPTSMRIIENITIIQKLVKLEKKNLNSHKPVT